MAENPDNPEDGLELPDLDSAADLVEVYHTDNEMAASTVIDEILAPAGIQAFRHDRRSKAFPAPASMPGEIGVAVPAAVAERARRLIDEARDDGVIREDGHDPEDADETGMA